ncbi:glutaredoxin-1 [Petromyzon marinus]|uniref:Glutaredoxin-1 n=1 Tax=Petromyzon marinus TaxID=7757 RepID=A0AAJ7U0L3_PETMA|nr:glutaredoxin-1 [Petromyzon marinus]XP_032826439.1 glutaredoxin-1 [Petromyzon marinus]XP_032826441.1 glutaredoxin-1 [Petromyzon marinus]
MPPSLLHEEEGGTAAPSRDSAVFSCPRLFLHPPLLPLLLLPPLLLLIATAAVIFLSASRPIDRDDADAAVVGMAQLYVTSRVRAGKVVVFVKRGCPFCTAAEAVLSKYRFRVGALEVHDIGSEQAVAQIQDFFLRTTGERTVPRVYIGEKCIGGGSDTEALERRGLLEGMLQEIGVLQ